MFVTTEFSIRDLENLSGVKAHTIRIWEKRYGLLQPTRTDTNIRKYDLVNLKKLLNVTFLYNGGHKISKIAEYDSFEIENLIRKLALQNGNQFALQSFKTAMFEFNSRLFGETYDGLMEKKSFHDVFYEVFIPLLHDIGTLWQTGTIDPAHERFISELIKQKIIQQIDNLRSQIKPDTPPEYVLYLPYEEIHEIGLLFVNYEILSQGFNTIYLGTNIPIESLKHVLNHHPKVTFVSYLTIKPDQESVYDYVARFHKEMDAKDPCEIWILGSKVQQVVPQKLPNHSRVFTRLKDLEATLKKLKSA